MSALSISGTNMPPMQQMSSSQGLSQAQSQRPELEGMQAGGRPQGPPPGGMPQGMQEVMSESDMNEAKTTLDSLTEDQQDEFQVAMQQLKTTAEDEGYSLEQVADSFLAILEEVSGSSLSTGASPTSTLLASDRIIDIYA